MRCKAGQNMSVDYREELMGTMIMTADDSASIRQMVSFSLKGAGYDVIEASDGKDALAKLGGATSTC